MRRTLSTFAALAACVMAAAQPYSQEKLSRALAGVASDKGFHLSWRMLPDDDTATPFEIWRQTDGSEARMISDEAIIRTTDFLDTTADLSRDNTWILKSSGKELARLHRKAAEALPYISVPIRKPEGRNIFRITSRFYGESDQFNPGAMGDAYTYSAGDCSAADLDGDGDMEIILKWNPSNSTDPDQTGVTGNTILDAYRLDGTLMWRIDLGHNVRSSYASVPFVAFDLDCDGRAEIVCRTADGTVDGLGKAIGNGKADWRSMDEASETFGRTVIGPEYITVFDGLTGKAVDTQRFIPLRFPLDSWGGIGKDDDLGILSENYTAGVGYFQEDRPSVFFTRGGQARTVVAAWDFRDGRLTSRWTFDSSKASGGFSGNGNPNVTVGDFDSDGLDEVCVGAMVVDHDGTGLSTTRLRWGIALHAGDLIPSRPGLEIFGTHDNSGAIGAFLGNPAMAVYDGATGETVWSKGPGEIVGRGMAADIDPTHEGAEMWIGSVDPRQARGRGAMPGRPMPAAPALAQYEGPLKGLYDGTTGELISERAPSSCNFSIYWDADPQSELLDGTTVSKWNWKTQSTETLLNANGVKAINGTKAVPCLAGDILGDWREEIVWVDSQESCLRIYMTPFAAANRIPTLLSDRMYRLSLVWQNAGHNQPPHLSYDLAGRLGNNSTTK